LLEKHLEVLKTCFKVPYFRFSSLRNMFRSEQNISQKRTPIPITINWLVVHVIDFHMCSSKTTRLCCSLFWVVIHCLDFWTINLSEYIAYAWYFTVVRLMGLLQFISLFTSNKNVSLKVQNLLAFRRIITTTKLLCLTV
jgi:hypothetical protein